MTYWKLISTGDPVQTGDPVGSDRITTSPARAGTGEPLHRLEPVPVRPETDRYHALVRCAVVTLTSLVHACQSLVVCFLHSIDVHRRGPVDAVFALWCR